MTQTHISKSILTLAVTVSLFGCGGGHGSSLAGDTSNDPVAKYIGSWKSDCYSQDGASARAYGDFTKSSATGFTGSVVAYVYLGTSCSGPSVKSEDVLTNMTMSLTGAKTIEGQNADTFVGSSDQGSAKIALATEGTILRVGDNKSDKDAEGYPTAFYKYIFTRR